MERTELRIIEATEADVPEMMELQFAACEGDPFHLAIWGSNTQKTRDSAGHRLLTKWRNDPFLHVVKCVKDAASDTAAGTTAISKSAVMAFCLWDIFERERSAEEWMAEDELQTCDWLQGRAREVARAYLMPALEGRRTYMQGRPYCLLTNLCTHPDFQQKGAAIALVKWGVRKADELHIPAYLEASEVGYRLYAKMGFERVDTVKTVIDGQLVEEYPAMLREASTT